MQEGITTPMKFLRNTGFQNSTIRARRLGIIEGEARGKAEGLRSAVTSLLFSRFEKIAPLWSQRLTSLVIPASYPLL